MAERSEQLRLPFEARHASRIGCERVGKNLDRDVALQAGIRAGYTRPMPPSPIRSPSSYGPSFIADK